MYSLLLVSLAFFLASCSSIQKNNKKVFTIMSDDGYFKTKVPSIHPPKVAVVDQLIAIHAGIREPEDTQCILYKERLDAGRTLQHLFYKFNQEQAQKNALATVLTSSGVIGGRPYLEAQLGQIPDNNETQTTLFLSHSIIITFLDNTLFCFSKDITLKDHPREFLESFIVNLEVTPGPLAEQKPILNEVYKIDTKERGFATAEVIVFGDSLGEKQVLTFYSSLLPNPMSTIVGNDILSSEKLNNKNEILEAKYTNIKNGNEYYTINLKRSAPRDYRVSGSYFQKNISLQFQSAAPLINDYSLSKLVEETTLANGTNLNQELSYYNPEVNPHKSNTGRIEYSPKLSEKQIGFRYFFEDTEVEIYVDPSGKIKQFKSIIGDSVINQTLRYRNP